MSSLLAIAGAIVATLTAFVWAIVTGRKQGKKNAEQEARIKDLENANSIRNRSDNTPERLSEYDDAGYRD